MKQKRQAPDVRGRRAGAYQALHKGNYFSLGYHQLRVYNLLLRGGSYSAADISIALGLSDPRSVIRGLRKKGVNISDKWCNSEHGGRFKRYFIHDAI